MKKIIVSGILLLSITATYAQNCTGTHTLYCNPYLGKDKDQRKVEEAANWQTTTQSKSGAFVQGDTVDISIVIQKDTKYRITVGSADEALTGKIQMMLVESETTVKLVPKTEKVTRPKVNADGETIYEQMEGEVTDADGNVSTGMVDNYDQPIMETVEVTKNNRVYIKKENELYDNADDNNAQSYIFTTDRTRKLTVRIITPVVGGGAKKGKGLGTEAVSCVGVLIEHAKGPATGTNKAR
jgi:hypothetical protein